MENLLAHQNEGGDGLIFEDTPTGGTVAIVKDERYLHIMAAAPDLLAALKALLESGEKTNRAFYVDGKKSALLTAFEGQTVLLQNARDAIRKAQGD